MTIQDGSEMRKSKQFSLFEGIDKCRRRSWLKTWSRLTESPSARPECGAVFEALFIGGIANCARSTGLAFQSMRVSLWATLDRTARARAQRSRRFQEFLSRIPEGAKCE